jgi:hypothetical protein
VRSTADGRRNNGSREGETKLYLLTTWPLQAADACTLARLYRERWTLEKAFLHLTMQLHCKINTLAYPAAALFGLAMALATTCWQWSRDPAPRIRGRSDRRGSLWLLLPGQ